MIFFHQELIIVLFPSQVNELLELEVSFYHSVKFKRV